jgi:hypothetical protein
MLMAAALAGGALAARLPLIRLSSRLGTSLQETLTTTNSGLILITQSLDDVEASFDELQSSLNTLETSVAGLSPFLQDLSVLIGTDMSAIASQGATTLKSASESSRLIDSTLQLLARIPLLRLDYVPEVPLHETLENLSGDMNRLSPLLEEITADLEQSAGDIELLGKDIGMLSVQTAEIKSSLANAGPILESYQKILSNVQADLGFAFHGLPGYVKHRMHRALSFLRFWAFLSQLMRLLEGLEALKSGKITLSSTLCKAICRLEVNNKTMESVCTRFFGSSSITVRMSCRSC